MRLFFSTFLCFVFLSVPLMSAYSARFSSSYLLNVCNSDEQGKEVTSGGHLACQAYIAGIIDYHDLLRSMGVAPSVDFCVPKEESMGVVQNNIVNYLRENKTQQGPFIASSAVALGLFLYYPCPSIR
jgi:hypothetical protein